MHRPCRTPAVSGQMRAPCVVRPGTTDAALGDGAERCPVSSHPTDARALDLRILGPVEARIDGAAVSLGGGRPRTVVAALALGGEVISAGRLIEEVWRSAPPRSATATLQSYLSRLRRIFGPERLVRHAGGYALVIGDDLDVVRFEVALREARAARDAGSLKVAARHYSEALDTWRGDVAEGIDAGPVIREAAARLGEHRLLALEERVEVELSSGRHHEIIGELESLTGAHPHRERLHAQRLVALYRAGRQADALAAYRQARAALVDGLGIEPGPQLRELQQRVLDQDPALGLHAAEVPAAIVVEPPTSLERPGDRRDAERSGNLPEPLGSFIGRVGTRREIAARLAGDARLITLVGAGGCGKTQLALRAACDVAGAYPDGVWWVELAAHRDPALVERSVADALGMPVSAEVARYDRVADRLGEGRQLLVVDNCEHLIDACADLVAELLRRCPDLRILATSREPLDVEGEATWRVPSLELAPEGSDPERVLASEAAQLLLARARMARPNLAFTAEDASTVAQVCRELDGIPLALELAAARLNVLSLDELAERLSDRFRILAHGRRSAPARHRTLEAAIAWSYDLLEPDEQLLLARLSVFSGGFTVDDAEIVCSGPSLPAHDVISLLSALLSKSLAQGQTGATGRARHDLLESVRTFARARLEPSDAGALAERHAERFAALAEHASPRLTGPDQVDWLNRLHADQDNLRTVLRRGGIDAARIAAAVWWFWLQFGHAAEGDRWVRASLEAPEEFDDRLQLELHRGAARLALAVDDPDRARDHLLIAVSVAEAAARPENLPEDHGLLARVAAATGDHDESRTRLATARDQAVRATPWAVATVEHHAAVVEWYGGDLRAAAVAAAAAERGFQEAGDGWSACLARLGAARIAHELGNTGDAVRLHRTNLARGLDLTVSSFDFVGLPQDLQDLAVLAGEGGDHHLAVTLAGAAASLRTAVELPGSTSEQHDRVLETAANAIGADEVNRLYDHARGWPAPAAVRHALEATAELLAH
ncbi:MAG: AfsR/SARP family transcriptional regulator [Nitriliruptor sp.]|nr:MAG: AfsR/SARP family transcriptional regulator [Nitriliruptor sp.]